MRAVVLPLAALLCLAGGATRAPAQQGPTDPTVPAPDPAKARPPEDIPRIDVIGQRENLAKIPGSGYVLDEPTLQNSHVFTTNEALRKIPGLTLRDEEGFGLRPNIGVRGLNPTRSTKVTLLEDGVPLAYAPYGDNASYYHPPIDRFQRIEVIKGAGQILYGPQTIGGVIDYVSPTPPQTLGGLLSLTGGNRDYFNGHARIGARGVLLDYVRKQGDGARDNIDSELNDLNLKTLFNLGDSQDLVLRANYYSEDSHVTYSGLTETELQRFGLDYNPFTNDEFEVDRYGFSATHDLRFNERVNLITNAYYSYFSRDWWRQSSTTTDNQCGAGFTAARLAGVAVNVNTCNSRQGQQRDYTQYGVEPRLRVNHGLLGIENEFEAGVRAHFETQERKQENAPSAKGHEGLLVEDNERETDAYSTFLQNRFLFGRWTLTPGVRLEYMRHERRNELTGADGSDRVSQWVPSFGVNYNPFAGVTLFAGVHRGFAPPRTEDLIDNTGISTEVDAEESTNYELGVRAYPMDGASLQATWFRNDFDQLIAVGSIAGGSTPLAEGEALFEGLELAGSLDLPSGPYLRLAYTYLWEAEQTEPFRQVSNGALITGSRDGNRQPYAPEHQVTAALGFARWGFDGQVEMVYVDEMYSDFANSGRAAANGNGQIGKINSYTIFNLTLNYTFERLGTTAFFTVKNLADKEYIVDRTRGIQVGMPRLVQVGARYDF
jgi:Fe(3+) dicitrate transport protein